MRMKWIYELTRKERKTYNLEEVVIVYDRVFDEYWTLSGGRLDKFLSPIKDPENKDNNK